MESCATVIHLLAHWMSNTKLARRCRWSLFQFPLLLCDQQFDKWFEAWSEVRDTIVHCSAALFTCLVSSFDSARSSCGAAVYIDLCAPYRRDSKRHSAC